MNDQHLLLAINAAFEAGAVIMKYYGEGFDVEMKEDNTPVTEADQAANAIIELWLSKSGFPVLSEEGLIPSYHERKEWNFWWCVDPLDGTKGFIKKNGEFAISIALMQGRFPVFGAIYIPVRKEIVFNWENEVYLGGLNQSIKTVSGIEAAFNRATIRTETDPYVVLSSRHNEPEKFQSHIKDLEENHPNVELHQVGSAIKFYQLAIGEANEYPRFQGSMEWDIAAGQAISETLGFEVISHATNARLAYNKPYLLNEYFTIRKA